ncbi:MAG TPA: hypothetical protein VMU22_14170 [Rhizomicrobium sp.]|nr:hypothetical protein [Rhizomicrobium sp.]
MSSACTLFRRLQSQLLVLLVGLTVLLPQCAAALPSFSLQTNQPCSACHIDTYGPRLNQAGREFKLHGFTATDGQSHPLPISVFAEISFTRNSSDNLNAERAGFPPNDYFSVDQVDGYYAGKVFDNFGAVASISYQPDYSAIKWGNLDLRSARDFRVFGTSLVAGATINNAPSEADLWDPSPLWTSPFIQSRMSKVAQGEPLTDMIGGFALGAGAYALWDDTVYIEADGYSAMGRNALNMVGAGAVLGTDQLRGTAPYWRVALQHQFSGGEHYIELGTYGLSAHAYPYSIEIAGWNHIEDRAFDFTYEWTPSSEGSSSDALAVHALYLHEHEDLQASRRLFRGGPTSDGLTQIQVNVAYTIHSMVTPGLQYFSTTGTGDPARWWASPNGHPNSDGVMAELQFVPWGTTDMSYNARLAVQYVDYMKYNGSSAHAASNNAVCLTLSVALAPGGLF